MLALEPSAWSRLTHAYGPADDIPALLKELVGNPRPIGARAEPWFNLWSSLCHQGDAYGASYAAVPHLVAIAIATAGPIDFSFFQLPASIEIARLTGHAPPLPRDLAEAYRAALADLHRAAFLHAEDPWDRPMIQSIATALAVTKGDVALAEALANLDDDWIARIDEDER